jgi:hypothetical protein
VWLLPISHSTSEYCETRDQKTAQNGREKKKKKYKNLVSDFQEITSGCKYKLCEDTTRKKTM